jgi:hypothetical protein
MPSARESRAALQLLTSDALRATEDLFSRLNGSAEQRRLALLETVPGLIDYYSDGSAALAADLYEEERDLAGVTKLYAVEPIVDDRVVKQRRGIAWASDPLFGELDDAALVLSLARLSEVVQPEVARPYRDTILGNRRQDPEAVGWQRISNGGCRFCRMLSARGAVYRESTVRFASHPNCHCTAVPVFVGNYTGEEASTIQYVASRRSKTPAQKAELRDYLDSVYGPDPH